MRTLLPLLFVVLLRGMEDDKTAFVPLFLAGVVAILAPFGMGSHFDFEGDPIFFAGSPVFDGWEFVLGETKAGLWFFMFDFMVHERTVR